MIISKQEQEFIFAALRLANTKCRLAHEELADNLATILADAGVNDRIVVLRACSPSGIANDSNGKPCIRIPENLV